MKILSLLIACLMIGLLRPAYVAAAPPQQTFGCNIVGSLPQWAREWGQSTGLSPKWVDEVEVPLDRITMRLRVCAPTDRSVEAEQALKLLVDTLPLLQRHAGPTLKGSLYRQILFVPPNQLPPNIDGMLDQHDVIVLMPSSMNWTVVHEGAHYWANSENFQDWWMVEGYAEYLTESVMIDLGRDERMAQPQPACAQVALLEWTNDPTDPNACGYTVGAAVFRDLANATSAEQLQRALQELSAGGRKIDSYSLLTALERASSQDLTPIMQRRVFPVSWDESLNHRRELLHQLARAIELAKDLKIELPADLRASIDDLGSHYADAWLSPLIPLLGAAQATEQHCRQIGLGCKPLWQPLPARAEQLAPLTAQLQAADQVVQELTQLEAAAREVGLAVPERLRQLVATLDPSAAVSVRQAAQALSAGRALDARCTEFAAPCGTSWQMLWSSGELDSAENAIAQLNELLQSASAIEQRCTGVLEACRAEWHPGLQQGDLVAAKQALSALEQMFSRAGLIEQRCAATRDTCHAVWIAAFRARQVAGSRDALNSIEGLLRYGHDLEQQCRQAGWPCDETWRAAFRKTGDIQSAQATIAEMRRALPTLQQAAKAAAPELANRRDRPGQPLESSEMAASIGAARQALAQGDIHRALEVAQHVIAAKERAEWLAVWTPRLYLVSMVGICGLLLCFLARLLIWRRSARQPASNEDLLANLLAQPPGRTSRRP